MLAKAPRDIETNAPVYDMQNDTDSLRVAFAWSADNEELLVEWGDIAMCYRWMHSECHRIYAKRDMHFTIPIIVLSTITGTASFAQMNTDSMIKQLMSIGIGSVNLFVGVLGTVQQYLKLAELREMHRSAALAWDKLSRNIRIELSKCPEDRTPAKNFVKTSRMEFDRLMEMSPAIRSDVIIQFFALFSGDENTVARRKFEHLYKPDICNSITSINDTRRKWFDEPGVVQNPSSVSQRRSSPVPNFKKYGEISRKQRVSSVPKLQSRLFSPGSFFSVPGSGRRSSSASIVFDNDLRGVKKHPKLIGDIESALAETPREYPPKSGSSGNSGTSVDEDIVKQEENPGIVLNISSDSYYSESENATHVPFAFAKESI